MASEPATIYLDWFRSTHLAQEPYRSRLNHAFQEFRAEYGDRRLGWMDRLMAATINYFHRENSGLARWPQHFLTLFHRSMGSGPFATFAQPKYIEWRKQAVAVWYMLLHFLAFNWHEYGNDGALERLGFEPDRIYRELIDDMTLYATLQQPKRAKTGAVAEAITAFFHKALVDPKPTVRRNPLLWWLAVLIRAEVEETSLHTPRLPIPGLVDRLGFTEKLEALDHYARVLLVREEFGAWMRELASPFADIPEYRKDIADWLDGRNVKWVDRNVDHPPEDFLALEADLEARAPGFGELYSRLEEVLDRWVAIDSAGPMHEVLALYKGLIPAVRPLVAPPKLGPRLQYQVQYQICDQWTYDPILLGPYKSTVYSALEQANRAATQAVEEECGLPQHAIRWDRREGSYGEDHLRAIFIDLANNTKMTAWVTVENYRGNS